MALGDSIALVVSLAFVESLALVKYVQQRGELAL